MNDFTKEELKNLLYAVASTLETETVCSPVELEDLRVKLQDFIIRFDEENSTDENG